MGAPRTTPAVLAAFNKRPHLDVSVNDLAADTGLEVHQVQSAVTRLIGREGLPIKVILKAQVWRYEPGKPSDTLTEASDTLFEAVGTAAKGDMIVRGDVTGKLYRVVAI